MLIRILFIYYFIIYCQPPYRKYVSKRPITPVFGISVPFYMLKVMGVSTSSLHTLLYHVLHCCIVFIGCGVDMALSEYCVCRYVICYNKKEVLHTCTEIQNHKFLLDDCLIQHCGQVGVGN